MLLVQFLEDEYRPNVSVYFGRSSRSQSILLKLPLLTVRAENAVYDLRCTCIKNTSPGVS